MNKYDIQQYKKKRNRNWFKVLTALGCSSFQSLCNLIGKCYTTEQSELAHEP